MIEPLLLNGSTGETLASLTLPKLLDNEGGGTDGYDRPLEGTANVGIIAKDKLDGGLVTFVSALA